MPTYRQWTPPVETPIAAIHGWVDDISSAHELARRLVQEAERESADLLVVDALSAAAVVRYCRCFSSGIRQRLRIDELPSASAADIAFHERIRRVRDRHVAHPVNQQEVHALYLMVDESPGATTAALGISSQASSLFALDSHEAQELVALCEKWIKHLRKRLAEENLRLMPLVQRLSREELLALPQGEPQANSDVDLKRT